MHRGYVKLYRRVINSGLIGDPHLFQLFCYLLVTAAHKPYRLTYRGSIINLSTGQLFTSLRHLSGVLGSSVKVVRKRLDLLENMGTLGTQRTRDGTIVTICKWVDYQSSEDTEGTRKGSPGAKQRQTEGKPRAQDQEAKKGEKEKNEKKELPYSSLKFERAWQDFITHRKQIKKPMTPLASSRILIKLGKYESERIAIAVLDQSIENGWTGLFELKKKLEQEIPMHYDE